jgi:hypothetical protein
VRIDKISHDDLIYEGRALAMTVQLTTFYSWAGEPASARTSLVFDVQSAPDDWIILGKKRGYYIANVRPETTTKDS